MRAHTFVVAVLLLAPPILQAQQTEIQQDPAPPLSVSDIDHGLKAGVTNARMAVLVKQYGVDFELTDVVEKQLRGAGANSDLLLAISRGKRSGGTSQKSPSAEPIPPNASATTQTPAPSGARYSVDLHLLVRPGIGYMHIAQFNETTAKEVQDALDSFYQSGELKGLILDLRQNPGGLLNEAVGVADKFLHKGQLIVSNHGCSSTERRYTAMHGNGGKDYPLVVLVNRGTASAAEVVAGTIQDHDRGLIAGETTYSSGETANKEVEVKLTDSGRTVYCGGGITPDVLIDPVKSNNFQNTAETDPEVLRALDLLPMARALAENAKKIIAERNSAGTQDAGAQFPPSSTQAESNPAPQTGALPTKEEVNSFLQETFGYDPSTSWKIVSISPSGAAGFTEVKILLTNAQGRQPSTLYVSADGQHALTGSISMMPFGKRPYKSRPDAGVPPLPTEEEVNSFLHETLGRNPSLSWKFAILPSEITGVTEVSVVVANAQNQQTRVPFYVSADGEHAFTGGTIIPFGERPFDAAAYELQKAIDGPSIGSSDAPVTVVEFADFQCPTCKELQATVQKLVSQPNVRLVFQNFPLPSHEWAWRAAVFADCIANESNDAFWRFASDVYTEQSSVSINNVDQRLSAIAVASGVHLTKIQACLTSAETERRVQHSIKLGTSLDVEQLPTLFIGGRKVAIKSVPYSILEQLVTHTLGDPPRKPPYQSGASPDPTASNAAASTSHTQNAPTIASNDSAAGSGVDAHDCIARGVTMPSPGEGNWPVVALQNRCSKTVIVRFAGFAGAETGDEWTVDFRVEIDPGKSTTHLKMDDYKFDCLQGQSPNVFPDPSCSGWQIVWTATYKDSNQEPPRPDVPRRTKAESVR